MTEEQIPRVISGRYALLGEIGRGGMGGGVACAGPGDRETLPW